MFVHVILLASDWSHYPVLASDWLRGPGHHMWSGCLTMEQFSASFHVSEVNNAAHISWFNWLNNPQPAAQAEIEKLSRPVNI